MNMRKHIEALLHSDGGLPVKAMHQAIETSNKSKSEHGGKGLKYFPLL